MLDLKRPIILVVLIALPICIAIECFKCRECSEDVSTWRKNAGCGACSTVYTFKSNEIVKTDRKCTKRCTPVDSVIDGEGERVICCNTDLCNAAHSLKAPHFLLSAVFVFLLAACLD